MTENNDKGTDLNDYAVVYKGGMISLHQDPREPWQVAADLKLALAYPIKPYTGRGPMVTDEEWEYLNEMRQEDPKRFSRKDAQAWIFQLGDRAFDPREIASVGPIDDVEHLLNPAIFGGEQDDDEDDGDDEEPRVLPPTDDHGKEEPSSPPRKRKVFRVSQPVG